MGKGKKGKKKHGGKAGVIRGNAAVGSSSDAVNLQAMDSTDVVNVQALRHSLEDTGLNLEGMSIEEALSHLSTEEGDSYLEPVDIVYVEPLLKRTKWVPVGDCIPDGWLRECVQESHSEWKDHLPASVELKHLTGRLVPEEAQCFTEVGVGNGVVLIELDKAQANEGLVGERRVASASALMADEKYKNLDTQFLEMKMEFVKLGDSVRQQVQQQVQQQMDVMAVKVAERDELGKVQMREMREEIQGLQTFVKDRLHLSNKVKMRVALSLARLAVAKAVGKAKEDNQTWSTFISGLLYTDWMKVVGNTTALVKEILAEGAYELNEAIHGIPAEEVASGIAWMREGPSRRRRGRIYFSSHFRSSSRTRCLQSTLPMQQRSRRC